MNTSKKIQIFVHFQRLGVYTMHELIDKKTEVIWYQYFKYACFMYVCNV